MWFHPTSTSRRLSPVRVQVSAALTGMKFQPGRGTFPWFARRRSHPVEHGSGGVFSGQWEAV